METVFTPAPHCTCKNSFDELMYIWQSQPYTGEQEGKSFHSLIQSHPILKLLLNAESCITWVIDVRTGQYVFISENIESYLGYSSQTFCQGGIEFIKDLIHPDDSLDLWKSLRQMWEYLLTLPSQQRENYRFTCEYRVKKANGCYSHLLEQNMILQTDQRGNMTHLLGMCTDISNWKKSKTLRACAKSTDGTSRLLFTADNGNLETYTLLSQRQKEIVKLLAQGYSSKQIADLLYISFHTVTTHRQNIIRKTQCRNTSELIQFAISNGII